MENPDKLELKKIENELLKIDAKKLMALIDMLFNRLGQEDRPFMEKAIHTMQEIKHTHNMFDSMFNALNLILVQYIHRSITGEVNKKILDRNNLTNRVIKILDDIDELDSYIKSGMGGNSY